MKIERFIIFCEGYRSLITLKKLLSNNHKPFLVILNKRRSDINVLLKNLCKKNNINYKSISSINKNKLNFLKEVEIDLFILCGLKEILKKHILNIPKKGVINMHGGLLPKYRGGSPLNWQLINGEKYFGITILFANEGIDTGDILTFKKFKLEDHYTINHITKIANKYFPILLIKILNNFNYYLINKIKQKKGSYFKQRKPKDGKILFHEMKNKRIINFVNALLPPLFPGAFIIYKKKKYIINNAYIVEKFNKNFFLEKLHKKNFLIKVDNHFVAKTLDGFIKLSYLNSQ